MGWNSSLFMGSAVLDTHSLLLNGFLEQANGPGADSLAPSLPNRAFGQ